MTAQDQWTPPEGHPITIEHAKAFLAGELGEVFRSILMESCAPIFWYRPGAPVLHNGTMTVVRTPSRLLGVTAAHVIRQYQVDHSEEPVRLQLMNALWSVPEVLAISDKLDVATLALPETILPGLGKTITPLSNWPPRVPQEGRGIMMAGYPGLDRLQSNPFEVCWGLFTVIGIARRVTNVQVTWRVERDWCSGNLPANYDLGGIGGGPLIGWFETASHLTQYAFCGIISEAKRELENVVSIRADYIRDDGSIREPGPLDIFA